MTIAKGFTFSSMFSVFIILLLLFTPIGCKDITQPFEEIDEEEVEEAVEWAEEQAEQVEEELEAPVCEPNCVWREDGESNRADATLALKGSCGAQTDEDWLVHYHVEGEAWQNSDKADWRFYTSNSVISSIEKYEKVAIADGDPPVITLCFSTGYGLMRESDVLSTWVWLK